jgi:superoxide dismutase
MCGSTVRTIVLCLSQCLNGIVFIYALSDLSFPAYYLDYQERRQNYVNAFFAKLVNWDFAESNFVAAAQTSEGDEL